MHPFDSNGGARARVACAGAVLILIGVAVHATQRQFPNLIAVSAPLWADEGGDPPDAPLNLTAEGVSESQIALDWLDVAGTETSYNVERREGDIGAWIPAALLEPDTVEYQDEGLSARALYYYRVQALGEGGASDYSNEAGAYTWPPSGPLGGEILGMTLLEGGTLPEAWVDFAWAAVEREGTEENPFNSLIEALAAAEAGATVFLKPGAGRETLRVEAAVRLERPAGYSGAVCIGDPNAPLREPPAIIADPDPQSVEFGDSAQFAVAASGSGPLSYQWRRNGADLNDGGAISGAQSATLSVSAASNADEGAYTCLVSNSEGQDESAAAGLIVNVTALAVPADYATVQQAIDGADEGTVITVSPGTYYENLAISQDIVLRSTDPQDSDITAQTILDGQSQGSVITMSGNETSACVVEGFTIQNGMAEFGGGISGAGCAVTIRYNILTHNFADAGGAMHACDGLIKQNTIAENSAVEQGGGLAGCNGLIERNEIRDNESEDSGAGLYACSGRIQNNRIIRNYALGESGLGGGLLACQGEIFNNTVWANRAQSAGGGLANCNGGAALKNNIIWDNGSWVEPAVDPQLSQSNIPTYSCIQGWTGGGTGNITADPLMTFPGAGDLDLDTGSPCINAGTSSGMGSITDDFSGEQRPNGAYDIGADEYYAPPYAGPARPTNIDSTLNPVDQITVTVTWEDNINPPGTHYRVYRATHPHGPFVPIVDVTDGSMTYVDTSLTRGPFYYHTVTALGSESGHGYAMNGGSSSKSVPKRYIVLDAGHTENQGAPGRTKGLGNPNSYTYQWASYYGGVYEGNLTWEICAGLPGFLYQGHEGIDDFFADLGPTNTEIKLTRADVDDDYQGLEAQRERARVAKLNGALALVSIHFNDIPGLGDPNQMVGFVYRHDVSSEFHDHLTIDPSDPDDKDGTTKTAQEWFDIKYDQYNLAEDISFAEVIVDRSYQTYHGREPGITLGGDANGVVSNYPEVDADGNPNRGHWGVLRDRELWDIMADPQGFAKGPAFLFEINFMQNLAFHTYWNGSTSLFDNPQSNWRQNREAVAQSIALELYYWLEAHDARHK